MTAAADTEPAVPAVPAACAPCRGTGRVVSNLGGEPSTVPCPWCEGTGTFIAEHDAQAARRARSPSAE